MVVWIACTGSLKAQNSVTVSVANFKNEKGVCRACLFDNAEAFRGKGKPVQCSTVTITNKTAEVVFNVPNGTYAISVFHDANNNNKFDTNVLGIPKEGYGASKNNLPFAAAPTFQGNKFEVKNHDYRISIRLRYL